MRNLIYVLLGTMILFSCGKYEDGPKFSLASKKARLTGKWEVVEIDRDSPPAGQSMTMEFSKDGDLEIVSRYQDYEGQWQTYISKGDWEWASDKEEIEITIDGDRTTFTILRLTKKELWFEDEDYVEYRCEKD